MEYYKICPECQYDKFWDVDYDVNMKQCVRCDSKFKIEKLINKFVKPKEKKRVAIYIGRFAPFHKGHESILNHCIKNYDETIVFIGSCNKRRTLYNPFPKEMIKNWIEIDSKVKSIYINDYIYNDNKWITQIEDKLYNQYNKDETEFTIVGHLKDDSSYYLKIFPTFKIDLLENFENGLNATDIRKKYFVNDEEFNLNIDYFKNSLNKNVYSSLLSFRETIQFQILMEERKYFEKEQDKFKDYPYLNTLKFNCSDVVLICDGNVLLVERYNEPGKGIWALPGGFVNSNETYKQAAIRKLYEETCLKIPEKVLNGSLKRDKIFDNPKRNMGIPRITNAFYYEIQPDYKNEFPKLPKVSSGLNTSNVKWFSLAEVRHMVLFDDHSDIIDYFVNN